MTLVRDTRTVGVTGKLSEDKRRALAAIRNTDGYQALLDCMEMACIEQETALISRDVTEPEKIVAEHRKTQAIWQMFEYMQKVVNQEVRLVDEGAFLPDDLDSAEEDESILNPMH